MPRKQNGFGKTGSFSVKGFDTKVTKGKPIGSPGVYPGNRSYGSSVHRTVIEKYDIDSDWTRWRKGIEYYYQGAYLDFEDLTSVLYQGTVDETKVLFDGKQFATKNSDSRSHYSARRSVLNGKQLGSVVEIQSDKAAYSDNFERGELWVKVQHDELAPTPVLRRMIGERLTDGSTEANVLDVLTENKRPTRYIGKNSASSPSNVVVTISVEDILATKFLQDNRGDVLTLIGKIGYFRNFLIERPINNTDQYVESKDFFEVSVDDIQTDKNFKILDNAEDLPPALLDISTLDTIHETAGATSRLTGTFLVRKEDYQRFYGSQYLTADVVKSQVTDLSYAVMPFEIRSVLIVGSNLEITAVPIQTSVRLFTPTEVSNYIIFSDNSFTKKVIDNDADGNYLHDEPEPNETLWHRLETDVDPWYEPVFTEPNQLKLAEVYCCSCPDFSHSVIRMPESTGDNGEKSNRQRRYPLPSAVSSDSYDKLGTLEAAGIVQSWETKKYRSSYRICKHTVAAMFINKLKVQEPKSYPSFDSRNKFEQRLKKDMDEIAEEFKSQLKRSGITTAEIVFMLAQGLNLDDIELAYVMLDSNF